MVRLVSIHDSQARRVEGERRDVEELKRRGAEKCALCSFQKETNLVLVGLTDEVVFAEDDGRVGRNGEGDGLSFGARTEGRGVL